MTTALWNIIDSTIGAAARAYYAKKYGVCRVCTRPLGGESPQKICVECHAAEVIAAGFDDFADGATEGPDA